LLLHTADEVITFTIMAVQHSIQVKDYADKQLLKRLSRDTGIRQKYWVKILLRGWDQLSPQQRMSAIAGQSVANVLEPSISE
jgi:hypothetical protein